jgi:hypothetical protein
MECFSRRQNNFIKACVLHYLSDDTIITLVALLDNFSSRLSFIGKSTVDSLEEMTTPQSRDSRAFRISEQDLMISIGANNNTIEPPKHRSLEHNMGYKQECHIKSKRRIRTNHPGTGRPPLADNIGAVKAVSASLTTVESANALPHRIRDERSMSAAANPLVYCVPEPRTVLTLLLIKGIHKKMC